MTHGDKSRSSGPEEPGGSPGRNGGRAERRGPAGQVPPAPARGSGRSREGRPQQRGRGETGGPGRPPATRWAPAAHGGRRVPQERPARPPAPALPASPPPGRDGPRPEIPRGLGASAGRGDAAARRRLLPSPRRHWRAARGSGFPPFRWDRYQACSLQGQPDSSSSNLINMGCYRTGEHYAGTFWSRLIG